MNLIGPSNEQAKLQEFKCEVPKLAKRLKKIEMISLSAFFFFENIC